MSASRGLQPVLTGRKGRLRPWTPADVDDVFAACQDAEIQRWTTVPSPYSRQDAVTFVTELAPAAWENSGAIYAVVDATTGELAGSIGVDGISDGVAHVGYWTAAAARGRGLTSDALRTLARWCLREGGAARVELFVQPANGASVRVAESAGFIREGLLRQRLVLRGVRVDVLLYSLVAGDPAAAAL